MDYLPYDEKIACRQFFAEINDTVTVARIENPMRPGGRKRGKV